MQKVKLDIDQVTPGMKLAEPITNASGITLMPAGIRLTPMFIVRLKKWNIETLDVFVEKTQPGTRTVAAERPRSSTSSGANLTAEQEEFARSIATEVARWFINVRENPLMMQLRTVVVKRLIAHGRNGMINVMRRPSESGAEGGV